MMILADIWIWALAGLLFGSFANVCIIRGKNGESLLAPSHCPHCNHQIAWYDLLPVVSFFLLRGQCRYCKKSISLMYPLVESLFCASYSLIYWQFGLSTMAVYLCGVVFFLAIIGVGDLLFMEIDDRHIIGSLVWILGWNMYLGSIITVILGALIGLLFACLIYGFGRWWYRKEVFGSGDVLLSAVIGAAAGYDQFLPTYMIAWSLMFLVTIQVNLTSRQRPPRTVFVPFAPVLLVSWAIICFYNFI